MEQAQPMKPLKHRLLRTECLIWTALAFPFNTSIWVPL